MDNEKQRKEIANKIFSELLEKYSFEDLSCLNREMGDLMWKKRGERHIENIKSQRKGVILQHCSGSYILGGERVKVLRKGNKRATVKVMTGKQKGKIWFIPYSNLTTNLTDIKSSRERSASAMNVKVALNKVFGF